MEFRGSNFTIKIQALFICSINSLATNKTQTDEGVLAHDPLQLGYQSAD
jgi:hypothetical protein